MLTTEKLGNRLSFIIIVGLLIIAGFFIINSYYSSKHQLEESVLKRLHSIANTTALQINGDSHQQIVAKYTEEDQLVDPMSDELSSSIFRLLKEVKHKNGLNTDIYTLFLDDHEGVEKVFMGVMSSDKQYYRHAYFSHPKELLEHFNEGHILPSYGDEHGTWLSAFAPIKNSKGETVAVIQADERFDAFLAQLRVIAYKNIVISLLIIGVISFFMLYLIKRIVKADRQKTEKLERAYRLVEEQNKKISDSINYAQRIQNSIVAKESDLQEYFPESFMYYKPKDVVSGDFPWMMKKGDAVYIAVVDCTGHGVPGAMLSFVGHFLLNEINSHTEVLSPNVILDRLHASVVKTLNQETSSEGAHDGMDIALCKIDNKQNVLEFSGAHRPLYFTRDGELTEIKGSRKSIGGTHYDKLNRQFENQVIELEKGDAFYFFSDGFVDQMGGPEGSKKLGSKKIRQMLSEANHGSVVGVADELVGSFESWMGDTQQLDDVLLIGFKI